MVTQFPSLWDGHLLLMSVTRHRIELTPNVSCPAHSAPYRAGPRRMELERERVKKMKKEGVVEPAMTKWASTVVCSSEKDGILRFCADYCRLNAITVRDSHFIPGMDVRIDSLGQKNFSMLDKSSGYWKTEMDKADTMETSFVSHN